MEEEDEVRVVTRESTEKAEADYDQKFLDYVQKQINHYQEQDRLGRESNLSFEALYLALQGYQGVFYSLLSMYEKANNDEKRITSQYQLWWDEKFILIRQRENKIDIAAQKWASKSELESMTRIENKKEYLEWEEKLRHYQGTSSFIKRLLDQWSTQSHILGHLKGLFQTDIATTNIGN